MSKKIDQSYLEAIKYGDFLEEFKKLGIPDVWKPGSKKADMVQEALKQLAELKTLKEKGVDDKDIVKKQAIEAAKRKEKEDKEKLKLEKEKKKAELKLKKDELKKAEKKEYSVEQIESSLRVTNSALRNRPTDGARQVLLDKKQQLMNMLDRQK